MSYKPGDFFVGVFELFAILLPGAMLAYIFSDSVTAEDLSLPRIERGGVEGWVAFALASYVLGYFVSVAGALLDELYDPFAALSPARSEVRNRAARVMEMSHRGVLEAARVEDIKEGGRFFERLVKASVTLQNPEAAAELERLAAVSKFFRSFAVVVLVFGVFLVWTRPEAVFPTFMKGLMNLLILLVVLGVSVGLYAFHRWRRSEHFYVYFIAGEKAALAGRVAGDARPTRE